MSWHFRFTFLRCFLKIHASRFCGCIPLLHSCNRFFLDTLERPHSILKILFIFCLCKTARGLNLHGFNKKDHIVLNALKFIVILLNLFFLVCHWNMQIHQSFLFYLCRGTNNLAIKHIIIIKLNQVTKWSYIVRDR